MANGTTIRAGLVLAAVAMLGGCYSIRHRNEPAIAAVDGEPAPAKNAKAKNKKADREVLPTGLAGDHEHHAYTDTPQ